MDREQLESYVLALLTKGKSILGIAAELVSAVAASRAL